MGEAERTQLYKQAAEGLPVPDFSDWVWTDRELKILRLACAARFDETLRTESLLKIAAAGIRIWLARTEAQS